MATFLEEFEERKWKELYTKLLIEPYLFSPAHVVCFHFLVYVYFVYAFIFFKKCTGKV